MPSLRFTLVRNTIAFSLALVALLPSRPALAATDPLLGEIMYVGFNFCPRGWMDADGRLLQISQHSALFSLYGTMYGGDGRTTFALPDLRGRVAVSAGQGAGLSNYLQGQRGGAEQTTLTSNQLPSHSHTLASGNAQLNVSTADADSAEPDGRMLADGMRAALYADSPATVEDEGTLASGSVTLGGSTGNTGAGQSFDRRQPYVTVRACVATVGTFPSRN